MAVLGRDTLRTYDSLWFRKVWLIFDHYLMNHWRGRQRKVGLNEISSGQELNSDKENEALFHSPSCCDSFCNNLGVFFNNKNILLRDSIRKAIEKSDWSVLILLWQFSFPLGYLYNSCGTLTDVYVEHASDLNNNILWSLQYCS